MRRPNVLIERDFLRAAQAGISFLSDRIALGPTMVRHSSLSVEATAPPMIARTSGSGRPVFEAILSFAFAARAILSGWLGARYSFASSKP
jgi:hypothetical protein